MIVSVVHTKGGVGKSTLAVNLAVARALAGKDVWLINGDKQRSALQTIAQRIAADRKPAIAASHYPDGKMLKSQVDLQASKYDDVIIESGGRDNTSLRASVMVADKVIIPVLPKNYELWAIDELDEILQDALIARPNIPIYAVLNMAKSAGSANQAALDYVADFPYIQILKTRIGRRDLFDDCAGKGMSVLEYSRSHKAKDEMQAFVNEVFNNQKTI